ncbi:hypothetical protein ACKUFS_15625 [Pseudomonas cannabina]|nr:MULTISPECIES: hypothetical protein [Pseudomonas syringae group]KPB70576.1 Uncharacterized protein AC507_3316 [Pseudomonas syringae pv. maculicola]MBM0139998.1 hypothetical protein [Pseudomonas cannabina pv. alisalensis]QHE98643.1 hypothetical protein PMA4326_019985 [Pseudomonas syringae pv. maculicola str. ES4326]QQN20863.1 hypothetical protein JGS08_19965 [Pseudomonas cannabina pv. alisalensis]RMO04305.1 hypothetical protein ALQ51_01586 [Pseudomonas cannabina]
MKQATPVTTKAKKRHSRRCIRCSKVFTTSTATKKYCSVQCSRKTANGKRPKVDRIEKARHSAPFYRLVQECKRAGTLEVLKGHTAQSLLDVIQLQAMAFKCNQYGTARLFELSHIAPVEGQTHIGMYYADNLVLSPQKPNKAHGTSYYGGGRRIARAGCHPRNAVHENERDSDVLERLIDYLGKPLIDEVVRLGNIKPTRRNELLRWLREFLNPADPVHARHLKDLGEMTTVALSTLQAELKGKEAKSWSPKTVRYSRVAVLVMEVERHAQYRPELLQALEDIRHLRHSADKPENQALEQALFDLLHGKALDHVQHVIDDYVKRHTTVIRYEGICPVTGEPFVQPEQAERIPDYKPIRFPMLLARIETPAFAPSFADTLDGQQADIVPVLFNVQPEASYDPVPW